MGPSSACSATRRKPFALAKGTAASAKVRKKCTFVWTASTTARIVGKLATSRSPILVSTDPKRIEIRLDADPRFAAAAAVGARYLCEASGLAADAASKLQAAILFACEEAFSQLDLALAKVSVTLAQFPDRIEVTIQHGANGPSLGLHTLLKNAASPMQGVDRVQYEQLDGSSLTRLTKFLSPHA